MRAASDVTARSRPRSGLAALLGFGAVMLAIGAGGTYFALNGARGGHGAPAASVPTTAVQPAMQAYSDPMARFTIAYPHGWRVAVEASVTRFYRDDLVTGPQFLVFDPDTKPMTLTAARRIAVWADTLAGEGRSVQGLTLSIEQEGSGLTDLGSIDYVTAARRGRMVVRFARLADGRTIESADAQFEAPEDAFASLEPVFVQMFKTYHPR